MSADQKREKARRMFELEDPADTAVLPQEQRGLIGRWIEQNPHGLMLLLGGAVVAVCNPKEER